MATPVTTTFGRVFPVTSSVMGLANVPFLLSGDREPGGAGTRVATFRGVRLLLGPFAARVVAGRQL